MAAGEGMPRTDAHTRVANGVTLVAQSASIFFVENRELLKVVISRYFLFVDSLIRNQFFINNLIDRENVLSNHVEPWANKFFVVEA